MSVQGSSGWATDPIRAAGGRRHYNSVRQHLAKKRRMEIHSVLVYSHLSLLTRGTQRVLAEIFGVSEATISRDITGIYGDTSRNGCCPFCGAKPLDEYGEFAIAKGYARTQQLLGGRLYDRKLEEGTSDG